MNCEQCEDQLLELLYGELPAQQATLVQSHADDCQTCLAALDELKEAMGYANAFSFDEPPASFDAPIMEAARSHVLREERIAEFGQAKVEHTSARSDQDEQVPFLAWLRGLMTGPQFAATAAMIAIVGVSIWALRKQTMQGDTSMVIEPSPMQAPAIEAAELEQAELADKLTEEKAEAEKSFKEAANLERDSDLRQQVAESKERAPRRRMRRRTASDRKLMPMKKNDDPLAGIRGGSDYRMGPEGNSRGYAPSSSSTMSKGAGQLAPAAAEPAPKAEYAPAEDAEDEARVVTTAYNRGINLYEARKYAEAARAFEDALSSRDARRSDTLFYLARSYRERGDCARAIKPYQAFLRENPKDARASTAQRELRDCQARIDKSRPSKAKRSKQPASEVQPSSL